LSTGSTFAKFSVVSSKCKTNWSLSTRQFEKLDIVFELMYTLQQGTNLVSKREEVMDLLSKNAVRPLPFIVTCGTGTKK